MRFWSRRGQRLTDDDPSVTALDPPARKRIEGGRTEGVAGRKIEARVMQWTANRTANHDAVRECPSVMRTLGTNGVELTSGTDEQHIVVANATGDDLSVRDRLDWNAGRQIQVMHDRLSFERLGSGECLRCNGLHFLQQTRLHIEDESSNRDVLCDPGM